MFDTHHACTEYEKKVGCRHVWCRPLNMKNKKKFFCYTPTHVGMHTSHRRNKKKLSTDMFGLDLLNMKNKKNFFLLHTNMCWCAHLAQTKEKKVERRHVLVWNPQHEKIFCHINAY